MEWMIILGLILLTIIVGVSDKKIYSPSVFFPAWWTVISFLAAIKAYTLNEVSVRIYGIVFIGCLSFVVGAQIAQKKRFIFGNRTDRRNGEVHYSVNKLVMLGLFGLSFILFGMIAIQSVRLLLSGYSMEYIRNMWQGEDSVTTGGFNLIQSGLYSYICCPFMYALIPFSCYGIVHHIIKKYELVLSILLLILYVVGCGGRIMVLYMMLSLVLIYFSSKEQVKNVLRKHRFKIVLLIAIGIIVFLAMSASRGVTDMKKSIYTYICGCMPHFEYRINVLEQDSAIFYGMSTLKGFLLPVLSLLNATRIISYPTWFRNMLVYVNLQDRISIGQSLTINAFVTPFYSLFADFRIFGVIFGMLIYGYMCQRVYRKFLSHPDNMMYGCLYALLFFSLVMSMARLQFTVTNYAYAFIILRMMFRKGKSGYEKDTIQYPL